MTERLVQGHGQLLEERGFVFAVRAIARLTGSVKVRPLAELKPHLLGALTSCGFAGFATDACTKDWPPLQLAELRAARSRRCSYEHRLGGTAHCAQL